MSEAWMAEHQEGEIVQVGLGILGECRQRPHGWWYFPHDLAKYCVLIEILINHGYLERIEENGEVRFKTTKAGEKYAQAQGKKGYYVPW